MTAEKTIFVIGGTGAQGIPVIEALTRDGAYSVRALTRDVNSQRAQSLTRLPKVQLVEGTLDSDRTLREGFKGCWGAFVNLDGFVIVQKNEIFWGIRSYQLAQEAGLKFFVWGNLDYVLREAAYEPRFHCGHYNAKGTVGDFIRSQSRWHAERQLGKHGKENTWMRAALLTTGPYLDMALAATTPMSPCLDEDGVVEWRVPLKQGAIPHIALADVGRSARWLFDLPEQANATGIAVSTAYVRYEEVVAAFTKVTGRSARFVDVNEEEYFETIGELAPHKIGEKYSRRPEDDESLMTWRENFAGFWHMWQASGGEDPLINRDYALLDEILPYRIKSVEEWMLMRRDLCDAVLDGRMKPVLKLVEDMSAAAIP